jgi:PAS domain-containing protein
VSDSARDKFFLTAADPSEDISPEERLKQVIHAKVEAGLLQPFNYANGYSRLQKYMDNYMNHSSKARILRPLSVFRPAFRAVAQSLKDLDLVMVEEAFERMLLDYDRVFTSMAIPACLWRRTGEIYRGNKEFAGLVEVNVEDLRDGKLAIYELMSEDSAVNYWEKYGNIAFDSGQKAVLTSCNLRTRDGRKRRACCFSFTVRRDKYNIPSCIIGNFIPIHS